ncbi:MAG: hypothetical protein U0792_09995 [Gemmataceae bacterium]
MKPEPGMKVPDRGPVHEPRTAGAEVRGQGMMAPGPPPPAVPELPPDTKPDGPNALIPGYWSWDADRNDFIWVSGFGEMPPPAVTGPRASGRRSTGS